MIDTTTHAIAGIDVRADLFPGYTEILSVEAMTFLSELHKHFNKQRKQILVNREKVQANLDKGIMPDFLPETKSIRESDWKVAATPPDLLDRRVEITGPVDRKMIINALNSGAMVFMADFEDSNTPSWRNVIDGQINLRDAINGSITFENSKGKKYKLNDDVATLMVRPRGWHLEEKHLMCNGELMSGSLVDFGLFFFHNANNLIAKGSGPYFYLPKLENHMEARLWNDVFVFAQDYLNIPQQTIKATVLVETILASFEMDEILYELKDHSAGLNCGRWDYIFSFIKKFRNQKGFLFPDRAKVGMTTHCMKSYSQLVIKTCHKRGVHAMGGMAAQIPIKNDDAANKVAMDKVAADKMREAEDGHDGSWVAHPGLVAPAMEIFNKVMPNANQINNKRMDVIVTAKDLLTVPQGTVTMAGLRQNINVGILYIESWLRGNGAAAIHNLMEDAATAEISRTQVWQWMHSNHKMEDGTAVTEILVKKMIDEELKTIQQYVGKNAFDDGKFDEAVKLFTDLVMQKSYEEFLTLSAYDKI